MVGSDFSRSVLSFDAQTRFLNQGLGKVMGKKAYKNLLKKECPEINSRNKKVSGAYAAATGTLKDWKKGETGLIDKVINFFTWTTVQPKVSAAKPYDFPPVGDAERETLETKASFHRTVAKVMIIAGAILLFTGILGPFALMPLLLSLGKGAAATTVMVHTGVGTLGVAGLLSSIFFNTSESVRRGRAKTDPDFSFFVDRVIQHKQRVSHNVMEEDLNDKAVHNTYLDWKEKMDSFFTEEKREKVTLELGQAEALFQKQPELFADALVKMRAEKKPDVAISEEVKQRAKEAFVVQFTPKLNVFVQALYRESGYKSDAEMDAFLNQEMTEFNQILDRELQA